VAVSMRRSRHAWRVGLLATVLFAAIPPRAWALGQTRYVETSPSANSFPLVQWNATASLLVDAADWPGVVRAARDLQAERVFLQDRRQQIFGGARVGRAFQNYKLAAAQVEADRAAGGFDERQIGLAIFV